MRYDTLSIRKRVREQVKSQKEIIPLTLIAKKVLRLSFALARAEILKSNSQVNKTTPGFYTAFNISSSSMTQTHALLLKYNFCIFSLIHSH